MKRQEFWVDGVDLAACAVNKLTVFGGERRANNAAHNLTQNKQYCVGANVPLYVRVSMGVCVCVCKIFNIADTRAWASVRPVRACLEIKCRYK